MDDLNVLLLYNKYTGCLVSKPKVPVVVTVVLCKIEGSRNLIYILGANESDSKGSHRGAEALKWALEAGAYRAWRDPNKRTVQALPTPTLGSGSLSVCDISALLALFSSGLVSSSFRTRYKLFCI